MEITDAKKHEIRIAQSISFPKGPIVAADRGYTDYRWFETLTENSVYFVTRQKRNASYKVVGIALLTGHKVDNGRVVVSKPEF